MTTDNWLDVRGRSCSKEAEKEAEFVLFAACECWFNEAAVFGVRSFFCDLVLEAASGSAVGQSIGHINMFMASQRLHLNAISVESSIIRAKEPRLLRPVGAPSGSFGCNC